MSKVIQTNRYDEKRIYAVRCPSCRQFMNVPGITLNNDKYIRCRCGVIGRTDVWIKGGQLVNRNN